MPERSGGGADLLAVILVNQFRFHRLRVDAVRRGWGLPFPLAVFQEFEQAGWDVQQR